MCNCVSTPVTAPLAGLGRKETMTGNDRRGQRGRWTAGEQFVNEAPTRTDGAFYGGANPPSDDARTDGGQDVHDVPGHGSATGVDDPVPDRDYGDEPGDRPAHVEPPVDEATEKREQAADLLANASEIMRDGRGVADAKQLLDQAWHDMTDVERLEGSR